MVTVDLPKLIADNINHFTGRVWLLPRILDWLEQSDDRIFLLIGGPGTGKSMIQAWLAGYGPEPNEEAAQEQLRQLRNQVVGAHFCLANSRNYSPQAFAESIANQLTENVPGFRDALAAILAERVQFNVVLNIGTMQGGTVTGVSIGHLDLGALTDEQRFDHLFSQPLKKLVLNDPTQRLLLLVDALDEAETYSGVKLTRLLSQLEDLPPQIRLLITTRPDPRVLKYFTPYPTLNLVADDSPTKTDIRTYTAQRLLSQMPDLAADDQEHLAARIANAAKGIFLYAHLVLNELPTQLPDLPDVANYSLPKSLSQLYQEFLNRELGRDEEQWSSIYRPMLGLIAVARGNGLTQTQLSSIVGANVETPLRICKQYLVGDLPEGPFRSFHKSFVDFLLTDKGNVDYHVDAGEIHRQLSQFYVQNFSEDWAHCDYYGLNSVVDHTIAAKMTQAERRAAFNRILTDQFVSAIQERNGWLYSFVEDLEKLATVEPEMATKLCFDLILTRPPNSLVIQHALRLLIKTSRATQVAAAAGSDAQQKIAAIVRILSQGKENAPERFLALLEQETEARVRGTIALALAETAAERTMPRLLEMLQQERGEASWAAADALVALNNREVIPELIAWYQSLQNKNGYAQIADKHRILYVLGWMHAEEAHALKAHALASASPKIIGRAVDLMWLLKPVEADKEHLQAQLQHILQSPPERTETLGLWADEWLQKRLVRALQNLHVTAALPALRQLRQHIQARPLTTTSAPDTLPWNQSLPKRERLIGTVTEVIEDLMNAN